MKKIELFLMKIIFLCALMFILAPNLKSQFPITDVMHYCDTFIQIQDQVFENLSVIDPKKTAFDLECDQDHIFDEYSFLINRIGYSDKVCGLLLSHCQLNSFPFARFKNIKFLQFCCIDSMLPSGLFELTQLEYLSISGHNLKELDSNIGKLKNLKYLSISSNSLKNLPNEIEYLENLMFLGIDGNEREFVMPDRLPKNLITLRVYNTRVTDFKNSLKTALNLKYVYFLECGIKKLPKDFPFKQLDFLETDTCSLNKKDIDKVKRKTKSYYLHECH